MVCIVFLLAILITPIYRWPGRCTAPVGLAAPAAPAAPAPIVPATVNAASIARDPFVSPTNAGEGVYITMHTAHTQG